MNFNINHLSSAKFHKNWSGAKYKDQIFENSTYSEHWQNIKGSNIIMVMFFIDKINNSLKNYVSDIFYATVSMYVPNCTESLGVWEKFNKTLQKTVRAS